MIQHLTDDCQLLIIKHLELEVQLALWEATEHLSSRLNKNVIYAWQRQKDFVFNAERITENLKYLNILLRSIGPTVQKLFLYNVTFPAMEHWRGHSFPHLQDLTYFLDDKNDNVTMELLVELFPGLTSLYSTGRFVCSIGAKWTQLRKLNICGNHIDNFASLSQFQMLEEISVDDVSLASRSDLNSLLSFPRLQMIYCEGKTCLDENHLSHITTKRDLDIQQITLRHWNVDVPKLQTFKNLRQLTLLAVGGLKLDRLQSLVSALPVLEQLHLIDFQIFYSDIELWQTVALCPSLNVFSISLYSEVFAISRPLMLDVLSKRSSILTLCCRHTRKLNMDFMRQNFQHSNLKLTFGPLIDLVFSPRWSFFKINMLPLKT